MAALAGITLASAAYAHSWYPPECCSEGHCHKADNVRETTVGAEVRVGAEVIGVPHTFKRRQSHDGHYHICYINTPEGQFIYCFFEPANT
jgi:hypothetical protein